MTTFKKRLSEAIKDVLCDMNSLSTEAIRREVESYINDQRTATIFYAWDNTNVEYHAPLDAPFEWNLPVYTNARAAHGTIPSLFAEEPFSDGFREGYDYDRTIASDDYFMFRAAA